MAKIDAVMSAKRPRLQARIEERKREIDRLTARLIETAESEGLISPVLARLARQRLVPNYPVVTDIDEEIIPAEAPVTQPEGIVPSIVEPVVEEILTSAELEPEEEGFVVPPTSWEEVVARWTAETVRQPAETQPSVVQPSREIDEEGKLRTIVQQCLDRLIDVTRARSNVDFSFSQKVGGNFISGFLNINLTDFSALERELVRQRSVVGVMGTDHHFEYSPDVIPVFSYYLRHRRHHNLTILRRIAELSKEEVAKRIATSRQNGRSK